MKGKVLFLDTVHPILQENLEKEGFTCETDYHCTAEELQHKIRRYEGLVLRSRLVLDQKILENAHNLKFVARSGSGMENIDTKFAESKNILCINSPEGNRDAVGEHALGMLLALLNKIPQGNAEVKKGSWRREENRGVELGGKNIGIIGFGNTGSAFAQRLLGFNCQILAHDKHKTGFGNESVKEVDLSTIFQEADIVSLHIPLDGGNHYFANEEFFASFQKNILFINTSRGPVLQTAALVYAMKTGKVVGACLDVLEFESKSFASIGDENIPEDLQYLMQADNTVMTPHVAGWTMESYEKLSTVLFEKIKSSYLNKT